MDTRTLSIEQLVGERLGDYHIQQLLSTEKLSAVYAARQETSQRSVMVTAFLLPESLSSEARARFQERFLRTADKLVQLEHPHIHPFYAYGEAYGYPYLVSPTLSARSLTQLLQQKGPLFPEQALEVLQQIASALDYVHLHGMVHASLKAENVLIDEQQNIYLTHFHEVPLLSLRGIEEIDQPFAHLLSIAGTFLGAPEYMAPEVVNGEVPGPRADIYTLGVLMYELLSGSLPFTGEDPLAVAFEHLDASLPPLHTLSPLLTGALDLIIQRALEAEPVSRYATAGKLTEAYERVLEMMEKAEQEISPLPPNALGAFNVKAKPTESWSKGQGLLSRATSSNPAVLPPTSSPSSPSSPSSETGGWQLRPPIITDHMAAIKAATGPQRALAAYTTLPDVTSWSREDDLLPPTLPVESETRIPEAEPEILPVRRNIAETARPLLYTPEPAFEETRAENARPLLYESEPTREMYAPVPWFADTRATSGLRAVQMNNNVSGAYDQLPQPPVSSRLVSPPPPVNKGRRKTLALMATGAVAVLGLGGLGLAHLVQQNPQARNPVGSIPAMGANNNTKTSTKTPGQGQTQGKVIGNKNQPENSSIVFTHASDGQPALLVHLPNGNFVAYERACTHEGVPVNYDTQQQVLVCPLHFSHFDPIADGKVLSGPAPAPLKRVRLSIQADGSIRAL